MKLLRFSAIFLFSLVLLGCNPVESTVKTTPSPDARAINALIEKTPTAEMLGNPNGQVTIIEFFDYRCHFCRDQQADMRQLVAVDPRVKVIYREVGLLGATSQDLAALAVAARQQGDYVSFHDSLLSTPEEVSYIGAQQIAKKYGYNMNALDNAKMSAYTQDTVEANQAMLHRYGMSGVPAFIVVYQPAGSVNDMRYMFIEGRSSVHILEDSILKLVMAKPGAGHVPL